MQPAGGVGLQIVGRRRQQPFQRRQPGARVDTGRQCRQDGSSGQPRRPFGEFECRPGEHNDRVDNAEAAGRYQSGVEDLVVADDPQVLARQQRAQPVILSDRGRLRFDPQLLAADGDHVHGADLVGQRCLMDVAAVRRRRERADEALAVGAAHGAQRQWRVKRSEAFADLTHL